MNKKEKALLAKTIPYDYDDPKPIKAFYVVNTHKLYDGGWGKNGFNNMIIVGVWEHDHDVVYYTFPGTDQRDLMTLFIKDQGRFMIDITNKWDSVHFWFDKSIRIQRDPLSTFVIEVLE